VEPGLEGGAADLALRAMMQQSMMPAAEHQADAALGRHVAPVAPFERARPLLLGRSAVRQRLQAVVVEPFVKAVQHLSLAGAVRTVDEQNEALLLALAELELRLEEPFAQSFRNLGEIGLVELMRQTDRIEHGGLRGAAARARRR